MDKRLLAIGDIHGCFDAFRELIESKIVIERTDTIVLLGDFVDRGLNSKGVIDYIIELQLQGFDIIPILGNHEELVLKTIDNNDNFPLWMLNGGYATLLSFGKKSAKEIDQKYVDFFKSLKPYHEIDDFLFVHAGFNDDIANPFDDQFSMLWTSQKQYTNPLLKNKTIIHGHCPITLDILKDLVRSKSNVLDIDTGCVYTGLEGFGRLTALDLYSKQIYSVVGRTEARMA